MGENTASARAKKQEGSSEGKTRRSTGVAKKTNQPAEPSLNMAELRELAELVNEHGFTDFEFENENIRVRLSKMTTSPVMQTVHAAPVAPVSSAATTVSQTPSETKAEAAVEDDLFQIKSPIVGTFYRSPSPDKDPYVKEGSKVSSDTVVCIVEAMKLMNEIQAEVSGEVVKIYVENGQPVEYGQPLFGIKQ
jgi:acetyl-CoA carboxylase biotin carboxyl carrier protein